MASPWPCTVGIMRSSRSSEDSRTARIQKILASRGLTFADAYHASRTPGSTPSLYPLPRHFRRALDDPRFVPTLYHLLTLSRLTRYPLADWLAVVGLSFAEVARLQTLLPTDRTVELDAQTCGSRHAVGWLEESRAPDFAAPLTPLTSWLGLTPARISHPVRMSPRSSYRFVKIGTEDAFAFPDLLPGSIVRIRLRPANKNFTTPAAPPSGVFLVEHSEGLVCTRLGQASNGKLVLCSRRLPYAPVELQPRTEAILHGRADLELRMLGNTENPVVPPRLGRFWTPAKLCDAPPRDTGEFIRRARRRSGLTFREAAKRTRQIAKRLEDARYYCAPATLSDLEAANRLPRNIHKIISVCAVYFLSPALLLNFAGVPLEAQGYRRLPEKFLPDMPAATTRLKPSAFFKAIEKRFGRIPYFLGPSLAHLFPVPGFSPRDAFWAGTLRAPKRSALAGALFLGLDRRQKFPRPSLSSPASQQPLYVLLRRDGTYLCGSCTLENSVLILRPCQADQPKVLRLRNHVEAEVVGRVTAVLRQLRRSSD